MYRTTEAVSVPRQAYGRSPGSMPPTPASSSRPHSCTPASSWPKVRTAKAMASNNGDGGPDLIVR